jgi:outer membrane protein assembly factor BamE (lipoprotein component of BamABCDE complex)
MPNEESLRRAARLSLPTLLLALFPSCFMTRTTVNAPIDRADVEKLVPGTSSAKDVVAALGAPSEVVQLGKRTAYRYEFTTTKRGVLFLIVLGFYNEDTRSDRVWLFFDSSDVLTHIGTTLEAADTEYALPWYNIHEKS